MRPLSFVLWVSVARLIDAQLETRGACSLVARADVGLHLERNEYDDQGDQDTDEDDGSSLTSSPLNICSGAKSPSLTSTSWEQIDQEFTQPDLVRSPRRPLRKVLKKLGACFGSACKKESRRNRPPKDTKQQNIQRRADTMQQGTSKMLQKNPSSTTEYESTPKSSPKSPPKGKGNKTGLGDRVDNWRDSLVWNMRARKMDRLEQQGEHMNQQMIQMRKKQKAQRDRMKAHQRKTEAYNWEMEAAIKEHKGPRQSRFTKPLNKLGACFAATCKSLQVKAPRARSR